jgi:hypothetical protein
MNSTFISRSFDAFTSRFEIPLKERTLTATAQAQHQVQRALLLDVVVGESAAVLQLLAREDEALLVGGDALLVLDLGLHSVDGVGRLHFKGDGLARQRLDEHLHATAQAQHQVQRALLLDVVVGESAAVLQLLAREDEALLVGGDALLVLDLGLHSVDGVGRLHFKGDCFSGECFDEYLHCRDFCRGCSFPILYHAGCFIVLLDRPTC